MNSSRAADLAGGAPSTSAYHKGNVAADLRSAAERILATERLEDVTLRRLAREVGVTSANFYNHYNSMDHLLFSIGAAGFEKMHELARSIFSREGPKADPLVAAATEYAKFCVRNRQLARLMFRRADGFQYEAYPAAANRAFAGLIAFLYGEEAAKKAIPPAGTHDHFGIAFGFFALWYGAALIVAEGLFLLDVDDEAELTRFIVHAVRPFFDGSAANLIAIAETRTAARHSFDKGA